MRMVIPRSQGKQPYYDARKSSWGDIFPHSPKNPPQVRHQPTTAKQPGSMTPSEGADIGKRGKRPKEEQASSYGQLASHMKASKKRQNRERAQTKRRDELEEPAGEFD